MALEEAGPFVDSLREACMKHQAAELHGKARREGLPNVGNVMLLEIRSKCSKCAQISIKLILF